MMLRRLLCLALWTVVLLPRPAAAGWQPAGPYGAWVTAMLTDPVRPGVVYAGTDVGGLYRSSDGGATWQALTSLPAFEITALAAGPASIYAGTSFEGLYESRDGGSSWSRLLDTIGWTVRSIAADPVRRTLLVILDNYGLTPVLKRSTDGGKHWSFINLPETLRLAADGGASGRFYVGAAQGIYRSTDGGATWKLVESQQLDGFRLLALAVDPVTHTVYAGGRNNGVFSSKNQGAVWHQAALPGGFGVNVLAARAGVVYAGAATFAGCCPIVNGFFVSTNGGTTWRASLAGIGNARINALAIDPRKPRTAYVGADSWGAFKSTDAMAHWTLANRGMRASGVNRVALDPAHPLTVWAGTDGAGLWRSVDGGKTWAVVNAALGSIKGLAFDPRDANTIFAASSRTLMRSGDGGAHWTTLSSGLEHASFSGPLLVDPQRPDTVYAGTLQGVFHSEDRGATWSAPVSGPECTLPRGLAASAAGVIYQAGFPASSCFPSTGEKGGLFASTDGGLHWEDRTNGLSRALLVIACDPAAPAAVYVSGSSLSRSTDEGASWQPTALPVFGGALLGALALGSGHPATVYASVGSKVYFSGDRGVSWALLGGQSLPYAVFDLAVDPDGSRLYAATQLGLYAWARE